MDYDEEDYGVSGSIPEFGAIFMSNVETKKECLKQNVFALPPSMAEFVKHIKAGMVLFLFEYKKRQLFGVYQASSDGAMDIIPHGFTYSGRHYPAQVCFTPIWHCEPLPEREFRDAIRENYFTAKKFKFGLSVDQVRRLLYLFSSRKLMSKISHCPLSEANVRKDRRMMVNARLELSERGYMEPDEYDKFSSAAFCNNHPNSIARVNDNEVLVDDGVSAEGKVHFYSEEDFLAKRRRLGNADKVITSDVTENGIYNRGTLPDFHMESPLNDGLDEVRRSVDRRMLSPVERLNKNQLNNILNCSGYLMDPLDVRTNGDFKFMQRNRLLDEYKKQNDSGQAFASDRLDTIKHPVQTDYNTLDTAEHMAYGDHNPNLRRQAREWIDDQEYLMNRKLENRYHVDYSCSPISAVGHPATHKIRNGAAANNRLPFNESEPDFGRCSLEGFSSEKNLHPLNIHDWKYPIMESRVNEIMADNKFWSTNMAKSAGYTGVERRMIGDERLRNNKRAGNEEDRQMCTDLVTSMEYPSFSPRPNLSSLPVKFFPGRELDHPHSTYDDPFLTRVVPYSPDHPDLSHGRFPLITANQNSSLVRESDPCHGDFYSRFKDRLPQDLLEPEKFSRPIDIAPEFGNKSFPNIIPGQKSPLLYESTRSFVNSNIPLHLDPDTSVPINYRGLSFSKVSPPHSDLENIGGENGLFAYPPKSRKTHFATASQHASQHATLHENSTLANKDLNCSDANDFGVGISHSERDWASNENPNIRYSSNMNLKELKKTPEAPHANSNVNRRSVFTRLTCKQESKFEEEKNDNDVNNPGSYMHATADEVMKLLQHSGNLSQRNLRESRVGGHGENAVHEKKSQCNIETNHSTMEASVATADGICDMPNETRVVDFKRRSDRKNSGITVDLDTHNKISCANEEVKNPVKPTLKRRKLVRPDFSKTGSATDAICSDETSQIPVPTLDKDDEQGRETIISCSEAEMPNKISGLSNVLASHPTQCNNNEHQILDKDAEQGRETIISCSEAEMPNKISGLSYVLASHPTECNNNEHQFLDKDDEQGRETIISCSEAEMPNKISGLSNVLASHPTECNNNEHQIPEEQKDVVDPETTDVIQSTSLELKGHDVTTSVDLQQVLEERTQPRSSEIQISAQVINTIIPDLNLPGSYTEGSNLVEVKPLKMKKIKKVIKRFKKPSMGNVGSSQ